MDVRDARNAATFATGIGCIVVIAFGTVVAFAKQSEDAAKWGVAIAGIAFMAIVRFVSGNVVRGRRCFMAERYGPIPRDDLDLSDEAFEKRLI